MGHQGQSVEGAVGSRLLVDSEGRAEAGHNQRKGGELMGWMMAGVSLQRRCRQTLNRFISSKNSRTWKN